jgi:hypothetical protein
MECDEPQTSENVSLPPPSVIAAHADRKCLYITVHTSLRLHYVSLAVKQVLNIVRQREKYLELQDDLLTGSGPEKTK